jgi:TfoX/Sxy family transcriptional regulator of competence genes
MAYSEELAARIRAALLRAAGLSEQKMFGGIAFLLNGNMVCGVVGDELMARVGPDRHEAALARPGARLMDFSGRPMRGMVFVGGAGIATDAALAEWVRLSLDFVASLPAKGAPPRRRAARR